MEQETVGHQTATMLAPLLFLCLSSAVLGTTDLPGGIKKCKNDNTLNDCIEKTSKEAIKSLAKGDPKAGVPVLDPLYIPKIVQSQGGTKSISMNLTLEKINIYGLSDSQLTKSELDMTKKIFKLTVTAPKLKIASDYILSGKFLVVPISGKGKSTIHLENTVIVFTVGFKLEKKKGQEYVVLNTAPKLTYTPSKMVFKFENLFNGDKALGDNVNKLLNENWKEFNSQLGPGVAEGIAQVLALVISKVTGLIPFKHLFL